MADFELGDQVEFRSILRRKEGPYDPQARSHKKTWERTQGDWFLPHQNVEGEWTKVTTGIIVGRRTLQSGETIWRGYEEGSSWKREGSVPAYLVAWRLDRKHLLVHPDDLTRRDDE